MQTKTVEVDGIKTSYTEEGSGPPVLFIHGLAGYKENWEENLPFFARRHRAVALDLPGFGGSDKPDVPYGPPWFAGFVVKFLHAIGIRRAHLVGNSMGGHIGSLMGAIHGEVCERIVLADPTGARGKELLAEGPIKPEMIEALGPIHPGEDLIRLYIDLQFFKPGDYSERMLQRALADLKLGEIEVRFNAYLRSLRGLLDHDMAPLYKDITSPTLVLWGENDAVVPAAHADIIAASLPNARKTLIPECGHLPMIEKPEEFNRIAMDFLA